MVIADETEEDCASCGESGQELWDCGACGNMSCDGCSESCDACGGTLCSSCSDESDGDSCGACAED